MADIVRPRTFEELARNGFDDVVPDGGPMAGSEDGS